jgi:CDP-diacylglycerol--glycerol-3-phosphate 3-phosphatidyltransferase
MFLMFGVYCVLCVTERAPKVENLKHNQFFGPFIARYIVWLISPVERTLVGRVSANAITLTSLALCFGSGIAGASGQLATAAWLYIIAGILDLMDGRLARASGQQSQAGALFDSVADRWGEMAVFTGFAWYLRTSPWLLAVMLAVTGSMMVSYTRARGEGLGLTLRGGTMQRAERIALVTVGTLLAAWFALDPSTANYAAPSVGWALLICGVASSFTAIGRWIEGYRALLLKEKVVPAVELRRTDRRELVAATSVAPVEAPARSIAS